MYKVAYISGSNSDISKHLQAMIESINREGGTVEQLVQSQSSIPNGPTIVTVTILYKVPFGTWGR